MSIATSNGGKIQIRNLNFYYGKFHALKNINLDIAKGTMLPRLSVRQTAANRPCCALSTKCIRSIPISAPKPTFC